MLQRVAVITNQNTIFYNALLKINPQRIARKSATRCQYPQPVAAKRIDLYGLQCKGHNVLRQRIVRSYNALPELYNSL